MKQLFIAIAVLFAVACNTQPTSIGANVMAQGSGMYNTSDSAVSNKLDGKFYYFVTNSVSGKIYKTPQVDSPLNGNGKWISLTIDNKVWNTVQVGADGTILQIK